MANALPFMQVNIASGEQMLAQGSPSRGNDAKNAEPGLFDSVMADVSRKNEEQPPAAQSASDKCEPVNKINSNDSGRTDGAADVQQPQRTVSGKTEAAEPAEQTVGEYPALEHVYSFMQGRPNVFNQQVLDMLAAMKDDIQAENPELLNAADNFAAELIDKFQGTDAEGIVEKITSLLTRTDAPQTLPNIEDKISAAVEELVPQIGAEAADELKTSLLAALTNFMEKNQANAQGGHGTADDTADVPQEVPAQMPDEQMMRDFPDLFRQTTIVETEPKDAPFVPVDAPAQTAPLVNEPLRTDEDAEPAADEQPEKAEDTTEAVTADMPNAFVGAAAMMMPNDTQGVKPADNARPQTEVRVDDAVSAFKNRLSELREEAVNRAGSRDDGTEAQKMPDEENANPFAGNGRDDGGSQSNAGGFKNTNSQPQRVSSSTRRNNAEQPRPTRENVNVRGDFQSFMDGVLRVRENQQTPRAEPVLNLRAAVPDLDQAETLREGIVNVVRFARVEGMQRASIVVDPPAIGRVSVELTSTSAGIEASIKVSSEQVRHLVQDQLTQLRMSLAEQGVQTAHFAVDVQQDNSGRQNGGYQQQEGNARTVAAIDDDEPADFRVDLNDGLLYWVA